MPINSKPAAFTVNTGATWCPDLLYMIDEGSGTTLTNVGKGSANNGTLSSTGAGSAPSWTTLGGQQALQFTRGAVAADGGLVRIANLQGVTSQFTAVVLFQRANLSTVDALFSVADISTANIYASMQVSGAEALQAYNNYTTGATVTGSTITVNQVEMAALKFKASEMGVSLNGGAFTTGSHNTALFPDGAWDGFSVGATADSTPTNCGSVYVVGVAIYSNAYLTDGDISTIYNSGDVWSSFGVTALASTPRLMLMGIG